MVGMGCFANMVGYKDGSANQIGLSNSAMGLQKEMTVVTNLEMGAEIDFATYYAIENYTVEAKKKKLGLKTYHIVAVATDGTGGANTPILALLLLPYILLSVQEVRDIFP